MTEFILKLGKLQSRAKHCLNPFQHNNFNLMQSRFQLMKGGFRSVLCKHMVFVKQLEAKDRILTTTFNSNKLASHISMQVRHPGTSKLLVKLDKLS
jgi:hypothetical protein